MNKNNQYKNFLNRYWNYYKSNRSLLLIIIIIAALPATIVQAAVYTQNGTNVNVQFENEGINITFANVTRSGNTSISPSIICPFPPDGFDMVGDYYNISTTAEHTGNITICINYNDSDIIAEKFLKVFHSEVEVDEFYAYEQSGINTSDTIWSLTGTSYPDILDSNKERLNFIIDSQILEINGSGDNFVYDTSIYSNNGETLIGWLGEPFSVIEKSSNWYISRLLINEDESDSHLIYEGDSLNLGKCFMLTLLEVDYNGMEAQFSITRCGEELCNFTVKENTFFEYNEDLNNSGCKDNWIFKFYADVVFAGILNDIVKINSTQFRSPDVIIIET
ncbi:MAG: S-layer protein domain-containing protein, partial [Methanosarcinales archaeon]